MGEEESKMLKFVFLLCVDRLLFSVERMLRSEFITFIFYFGSSFNVVVLNFSLIASLHGSDIEHITGPCMYVELQMRILVWSSTRSYSSCIRVSRALLEWLILLPLHCLSVDGESSKSTSPSSSIPMSVKRSWSCECPFSDCEISVGEVVAESLLKNSCRSHMLKLNPEVYSGPHFPNVPVVAESYNEIVFPDPFESFLARVLNHPAVHISKLPDGSILLPPGAFLFCCLSEAIVIG